MSKFNFGSAAKAKRTLNIERFRGVDFANSPFNVSAERSPDACNLIPDLQGFPVMRPGSRNLAAFDGRINGIHKLTVTGAEYRLVHHGSSLSLWALDGTQTVLWEDMANEFSQAVQMGEKLYIFDGRQALVYGNFGTEDAAEWALKTLEDCAYVPTTTIGRKAGAQMGGTALEDVNLIGSRRKNSFCVDSEGQTYLYLDAAPITKVTAVRQLLGNGVWVDVDTYKYNLTSGYVRLSDGLDVTPVSGMDNYEVEFEAVNLADELKQQTFTPSGATQTTKDHLIWEWPSSSDKDPTYATTYKFRLSRDLPKQSVDIVLVTADTFYEYQTPYQSDYDPQGKAYPRKYAFTVTTTEQEYFLGYTDEEYDSEDSLDVIDYNYVAVWLEKPGQNNQNYWMLCVTSVHTMHGGGYGSVRNREFESVIAAWYETDIDSYAGRINGCRIVQLYGANGNADRLFVSGNRQYPNMDWHSGYNDPTYWPDLAYTRIGEESSAIMGYSWLSDDTLAIHKAANGAEPTIWLRSSSVTADGEALFPVKQGAVGKGVAASGAFAYFGGDNLCLSDDGVFAVVRVSNEAVNERYAISRSWFIDPRLVAEDNLSEAQGISYKGRYYLAVNGHVYIADGNAPKAYVDKSGDYQYEWWYWEGLPVRVWYAADGDLMFGTDDGRIMLLDNSVASDAQPGDVEPLPVSCRWLTPIFDFGTRAYYKKIKNAYAIAEPFNRSRVKLDYILNSVSAEAINALVLDRKMSVFDFNDIDFADFAFETDEFPRNLASNTKAKKVMFAQFRLYNEPGEGFGIYGFTVLYTVSGKYKG